MTTIVKLVEVSRVYAESRTVALSGVDLSIEAGEAVAIVGPSGSGKSTLLNLIGTLDQPTSGVAEIAGMNVSKLSDSALSALRAYSIGFVFQQFHLSDRSTALDNVADGLLYAGVKRSVRRERARAALEQVGLALRVDHRSNQLSGGERQRVAIARAVVGEPVLLLADEPTGNLDSAAGDGILALLEELNRTGTTVVMITHDTELARRLPRRVTIRDGQIIDDSTFAKGAN